MPPPSSWPTPPTTPSPRLSSAQSPPMPMAFAANPVPAMPATEAAALQLPVDPNFVATQQAQAAGRPPAGTRTPPRRRRRQVQLGLIAAFVVILAAGAGITGYVLRQPATTSRSATTGQPTATCAAHRHRCADRSRRGGRTAGATAQSRPNRHHDGHHRDDGHRNDHRDGRQQRPRGGSGLSPRGGQRDRAGLCRQRVESLSRERDPRAR